MSKRTGVHGVQRCVAVLAAIFLSGCSTAAPGAAPAPTSSGAPTPLAVASGAPTSVAGTGAVSAAGLLTVVVGDFAEPNSLNPALSAESPRVARQIFQGLLSPDPKTGAPSPELAESWDQSADGLTYTFHIRPNVKWSDGQPFTADDAKFTFDVIRDPKNPSPFKSNFDQVTSIDVVDPLTLRVTLKSASCPFLANAMTQGIIPRHALVNSADLTKDDFNINPTAATGPLMFKERQKGDHITLVANPTFWRGRIRFDQWIFKVVPDATAELLQLKTGELDYSIVQPDAMPELQQAGINLLTYTPTSNDALYFNVRRPQFQDVRVRQALTYALDRQQVVQQLLSGQGQVTESPIPSVSWAFNPSLAPYAYDLQKAQQLLADAGWTPGPNGTLQKDGQPFQLTVQTNSGNKIREGVTIIAQAQWKKLGIDLQTNIMELNAFNQKVRTEHDFDAVVSQPIRAADPDLTQQFSSGAYPGGQNWAGYSNPDVDQLLQQAATVPGCGQPERHELYNRVQQIIAQDVPVVQLYSRLTVLAANKRLQGINPSPWEGDEVNFQNWVVAPANSKQ
jgi:peptide/nickel transport system substrate-binding protein